jgi:predicted lysophospholipase L1 biosynthesis ABC-type transport system permease subunit
VTVVGVAGNAKYRSIGEGPLGFIYLPLGQYAMEEAHFFIRRDASMGTGASLEPATRAMLRQYDRNLPLVEMASFRQRADIGLLPQRIASAVAGLLGGVALVLAAIGIYGVTAFAVASRTREIGVRVALGADPGSIRRLILAQALRLAAIGGGIGMVVALGASQLVRSFLFGLSPADPLAFGITAAGLASIALGAGLMPAVRAARVDPAIVLRSE